MKLSALKNRFQICKTNKVFTTRAMWKLISKIASNPCEIYWDYNNSINEDEFNQIHENGFIGLNDLENQLWDININYMSDMEYEQLKENIPSDLSSYRLSYLKKTLKEYRELEDIDVNAEDLMNLTFQDLCNLDSSFQEEIDTLKDYQSCDLNLNKLYINSSYEKSLWYSPEDSELREIFNDIIKTYESKGYTWIEPEIQNRVKIDYPAENINELAQFFENYNKSGAYIKINLDINLEFEKEDTDNVVVEAEKDVYIYEGMATIEDSYEYEDGDWDNVFEFSVKMEDENFHYPSDEYIKKIECLLENIPKLDEVNSEKLKVQCIVDEDFYVTELINKKSYGGKYPVYLTFGFNTSSGLWTEKAISISDRYVIPKNLYIHIDGNTEIVA